jgi:hypothetical protein
MIEQGVQAEAIITVEVVARELTVIGTGAMTVLTVKEARATTTTTGIEIGIVVPAIGEIMGAATATPVIGNTTVATLMGTAATGIMTIFIMTATTTGARF